MAPPPPCRLPRSPPPWLLLLLSVALLGSQARAEPAAGSAVPAQSRPCVDCHAFEFMQRALQDLRKTAYSLDSRPSPGRRLKPGLTPGSEDPESHGVWTWTPESSSPQPIPEGGPWIGEGTEALLLQAERRALCACWPAAR
ncbi:neuropeptide-like protein C4orf48 homolog isoform X1 [Hyaena hyaena]|uniref:neuropeptide-like protein C4orf48 homolog isoform X1 n=1 Tax=Hyaena hyaena TaxID=95912 RepID=UPI001920D490|nr:neuropeptide-like protein C4orf48 homolog isoform X1 [Hyaena hyaena]